MKIENGIHTQSDTTMCKKASGLNQNRTVREFLEAEYGSATVKAIWKVLEQEIAFMAYHTGRLQAALTPREVYRYVISVLRADIHLRAF